MALPLVVVVVLVIAQIGVVVRDEIAIHHAAREGARAASVSADPDRAAAEAVDAAVALPTTVATSVADGRVTVTVTFDGWSGLPIVGRLVGPVTHVAEATMTLEPP